MDTGREVRMGMIGSYRQRKVRLVMIGLLWVVRKRERAKGRGGRMEEMAGRIGKGDKGVPFFDSFV